MTELLLTHHNPFAEPSVHVWSWQIPVYLFLGGSIAGLMILSGAALLFQRRRDNLVRVVALIGLVLLSAGMLALFLDLEHKLYTWRLYLTFRPTSPMSWGAWILILVYPVLLALLVLPRPTRSLAMASTALGVALGIYTGILLSSLTGRPLWNSAVLGPLFLASGVSSATAIAHFLTREPRDHDVLIRADAASLAVELLLLLLLLVGFATAASAHRDAAALLLGGPYTAVFWTVVVGAGILLPLGLQLLTIARRMEHIALVPLLVIGGGLALRFLIVFAGQYSHWTAPLLNRAAWIG